MKLISRQTRIKIAAVTLGLLIALIFSEIILHVYGQYVASVEKMDDGLIQQDARMGWRLTPNWQGQHRHFDYVVNYQTNLFGFRKQGADDDYLRANRRIVVVGDSFTFGLGVNNSETFPARLDEDPAIRYINAGVPGYSPEQIAMRAIELDQRYSPELVLFVVYLGNDLVDIGYEFPIQAEYGKPFAQFDQSGKWQITNSPVLRATKPTDLASENLATRMLKPSPGTMFGNLKLVQVLQHTGLFSQGELDQKKLEHSLQLFNGLLGMLGEKVAANMALVVLPGGIAASKPDSLEARYQATIARGIENLASENELAFLDLTGSLGASTQRLYHPYDGHLTVAGNQMVADEIAAFVATLPVRQ